MSNLLGETAKPSVDVRTLRLLIGGIAIGLAVLVQAMSPWSLTSISGAYFSGDWPRNFFVGSLFFIAGFLIAYNGEQIIEKWLSKIAAIAAIGVATFPCDCASEAESKGEAMLQCLGEDSSRYPNVSQCLLHFQEIKGAHYTSALIMFGILAAFCYIFFARAKKKEDERRKAARRRMPIYLICLAAIIAAIGALIYDYLSGGSISSWWQTFVFWAEFAGLAAFGVSWVMASHVLPWFAHETRERYHPLRRDNPPEPGVKK